MSQVKIASTIPVNVDKIFWNGKLYWQIYVRKKM